MDAETANRNHNAIRHLLQSPGWSYLNGQIDKRKGEIIAEILDDRPHEETTKLRQEYRTLTGIQTLPEQQKDILAEIVKSQNVEADVDD